MTNAAGNQMRTVPVGLGDRSYAITIGPGALDRLGPVARDAAPDATRAFVVIDAGLPAPLADSACASLTSSGFDVTAAQFQPAESAKSLHTVGRLLTELAETRHTRAEPVVALGGGITGDVAGFVAASYRRGVPVIQCPTTLLAMVDASVGGKTGVNLATSTGLKKNAAGAFWQPAAVLADTRALASLPPRHLRAGLAECLKHSLLALGVPGSPEAAATPTLFEWIAQNAEALARAEQAIYPDFIARNAAIKAAVVADDERERDASGGRALLNLGHTFAHSIEPVAHLSPTGDPADAPLHHGEAVALGLVAAAHAAAHMGWLTRADAVRITDAVVSLGLPTSVERAPAEAALIDAMYHDKKVVRNALRLVLPTSIGVCRVADAPPIEAVRAGWDAICARPASG